MLQVTEKAAGHLKRLLDQDDAPEGKCIRIHRRGPDFSLIYDHEESGDQLYEHEGRTVLVVDEQLAETLSGRTIDLEELQEGPRLVFT